MANSKHTPGPWTTDPADMGTLYVGTDDHLICQCHDDGMIGAGKLEARANARLIAAAPDLLEALDGLTAVIRADIRTGYAKIRVDDLHKARAALRKATGGDDV